MTAGVQVIEPDGSNVFNWRELWNYRELLWALALRDVRVRYKQTVAGVLWAVMQPLLTSLVLAFVFGRIAGVPSSGDIPYVVVVAAGALPWQLFASGFTNVSGCLLNSSGLIGKIYFPRVLIPVAATVTAALDFVAAWLVLLVLQMAFGVFPDWRIVTIPIVALLALVASFALGILFAAQTVRYRDLRFVVPFLLQVGVYLAPVGYTTSNVPERWKTLYMLNPLASIIDAFRWASLQGGTKVSVQGIGYTLVLLAVLTWLGIRSFSRIERTIADHL